MKPGIRKILVPTDFSGSSDRAVEYAAVLATTFGASIHLVHVLEEPFVAQGPWEFYVPDTPAVRERLNQQTRARLEDIAVGLRGEGLNVTLELRHGAALAGIVGAAGDYGVDLIVMGTHGRSGLPHLLLGSVAERVIRTAPCPVLAVRDQGLAKAEAPADIVAETVA